MKEYQLFFFFFFQAEDGIRDLYVTGVQTCALPISRSLTTRLHQLASNLWWTWEPEVIGIFRDLDPDLWRQVNHNPVALLATLPPEQLVRRAVETVLDTRINFAFHRLERYLRDPGTWGQSTCGVLLARPVAYFSPEFALHESIPIYSGGLGALAGDHLKSACDLGTRLRQELILGIGGARMLDALGIHPGVLHLNEGHSAFAPVELARRWATAQGVGFAAAHREVALRTVFTTHTPVAAGHDYFPPALVLEHLRWLVDETGISPDDLLALGRVNP